MRSGDICCDGIWGRLRAVIRQSKRYARPHHYNPSLSRCVGVRLIFSSEKVPISSDALQGAAVAWRPQLQASHPTTFSAVCPDARSSAREIDPWRFARRSPSGARMSGA